MEIGIVGLPQSGKSTLFEIMTGVRGRDAHGETCVRGQAFVPDERFDRLVEIFRPVKATPASVPFVDINAAGEKAWNTIRQNLSGADGLVHVVDGFSAADPGEIAGRYRKLADELILADLLIVENRLERLGRTPVKALRPQEALQRDLLPGLKAHLEAGRPLREMNLADEQVLALRSFSFWTIKPELVVINTGEDEAAAVETGEIALQAAQPQIRICARLEAEIAALPAGERQDYLAAMGIAAPAFTQVIRTAFAMLARQVYFTVGEDEVRAWVIPVGAKAPQAAAAIHQDFERGFIKAEVVGYDEFLAHGGTLAGAKAAGRLRLEGKDYVVRDGDIISFRFNV
jgi:hypothetical protein